MIKDLNGATLAYDTENNLLVIVDQTLLPREYRLLYLDELEDIFEAIRSLRVRGAPAIGAAAAVGYSVLVNKIKTSDKTEFKSQADFIENRLRESRPTAVNLFWALDRMEKALENALRDRIDSAKEAVKNEALLLLMKILRCAGKSVSTEPLFKRRRHCADPLQRGQPCHG